MSNSFFPMATKISAGVEMHFAERTAPILDRSNPQVCDRFELGLHARGYWLTLFLFADIDRILADSLPVPGPEIELIVRPICTLVIHEWFAFHDRLCFRQIKRDFPHQPVMGADNEYFFAFRQQALACCAYGRRCFSPRSHAP